jgi:hypothetical protein
VTAIPALPAGPRKRTGNSAAAEREHIVRVLHSHPVYLQWLREHVAKALMAEATRLSDAGFTQAGAHLAARALRYRSGADE